MNRYKRRRYGKPPAGGEWHRGKRDNTVYYMTEVPTLRGTALRLRGFWLHPTKGWRNAIGEKV